MQGKHVGSLHRAKYRLLVYKSKRERQERREGEEKKGKRRGTLSGQAWCGMPGAISRSDAHSSIRPCPADTARRACTCIRHCLHQNTSCMVTVWRPASETRLAVARYLGLCTAPTQEMEGCRDILLLLCNGILTVYVFFMC